METLAESRHGRARVDAGGAALTVALCCDAPFEPPWRVGLAGIHTVVVGRGERRVDRDEAHRALRISLPDGRMSSVHARLSHREGRWRIADEGSKNGTFVAGERLAGSAALGSTATLELGRSFLWFRADAGPESEGERVADPADPLESLHPAVSQERARLRRIAPSGVSVLLLGETGVGKEIVARALHDLSGRSGAFVAINCGALPPSLVESELFGHVRGAFSGAEGERPGLVRTADGGTLFLDEIGELEASSQAALLRVLQEREVRPIGSARSVPVNVRVVAATLREPAEAMASGALRGDLYARVAGTVVRLLPLRDRREDLGLLAGALLRRAGAPESLSIDPLAARALFAHPWPYNVRELDNALRAALAVSEGPSIELEHLPPELSAPARTQLAPAPPAVELAALDPDDRALREQLEQRLGEHSGNVAATARAMGKAPMQLYRWIRRFGIDLERLRRGR